MEEITSNLSIIHSRIDIACEKSGRNPNEVKLLLATKTVSPKNIRKALEAGEFLIGENKVQELKEKFEALKEVPHESHFIGHLQSNKIKDVVKYVQCIQSIDRMSLAQKLQKRMEFEDRTMDIFIQVNTSYEESKFGAAPEYAIPFAKEVSQMDRLKIKGLMTIGLFSAEDEKVRKCFQLLKGIQKQLRDLDISAIELSMGMSGDLETAIEEGSTMVRVGTAVFGKRQYPDSYYWNEGKSS